MLWNARTPEQTTHVYCPVCRFEQVANDCFLEDTDLVRYLCRRCGTQTEWLFDAPAPLRIRTYRTAALSAVSV
jgi:hypothetical protein